MVATALQDEVAGRIVAPGIARGGDRVAIEVKEILLDQRPGTVMDVDAVTAGMLREGVRVAVVFLGRFVLVVVEVVADDPNLIGPADTLARPVRWRLLPRAVPAVVEHPDRRSAPAKNLHVGDFDVEAAKDKDPELIDSLLTETRALDLKAGNTDVIARRLVARIATDVKEGTRNLARVLAKAEERSPRARGARRADGQLRPRLLELEIRQIDDIPRTEALREGRRAREDRPRRPRRKGRDAHERHAWPEIQRDKVRGLRKIQHHCRAEEDRRIRLLQLVEKELQHIVVVVGGGIGLPDLEGLGRRVHRASTHGGDDLGFFSGIVPLLRDVCRLRACLRGKKSGQHGSRREEPGHGIS